MRPFSATDRMSHRVARGDPRAKRRDRAGSRYCSGEAPDLSSAETRLKPTEGDALDALPRGTAVHVMMLDSIDSGVNRDGDSFQAVVVSPLVSGGMVVIHSDAKARGVLALLRSQSHPEGFRYALLLTGLTDHGQSTSFSPHQWILSPPLMQSQQKDPDRTQPLAASN